MIKQVLLWARHGRQIWIQLVNKRPLHLDIIDAPDVMLAHCICCLMWAKLFIQTIYNIDVLKSYFGSHFLSSIHVNHSHSQSRAVILRTLVEIGALFFLSAALVCPPTPTLTFATTKLSLTGYFLSFLVHCKTSKSISWSSLVRPLVRCTKPDVKPMIQGFCTHVCVDSHWRQR